ncbi:hypothetical protein [Burkholderia contaminans]|uniref:Uncharacterized protein n=1 Tax=Burkholderia contaminans TaxID=488447 RepID=A0A6P2V1F0_9BURK|nr:hypothetical protein [Burkholderia contaminans]VWC74943.1 hypothetical protein BCO71171_00059 [Burkholderia contaminans]
MTSIGKQRYEPSATADVPAAKNEARRRSMRQALAVALLVLGIASICVGLYSLIQAFNAIDFPMASKIWLTRALTAMVVGWICLHIGSKRIESL